MGRRGWIRAVSWIAISIGATVVVAWIAALVIRSRGLARRDAALERIRARGEPLTLAEAVRPPRIAGGDPTPWLEAMDKLPYADFDLHTITECTDALANGEDETDLYLDQQAHWFDTARIDRPSACEAAVLRRELELNSERSQHARVVERYGTVDWRKFAIDDGTMESLMPKGPIAGAIQVVERLTQEALDAAIRGDSGDAVACLELSLRGASLFDDSPDLLGNQCWNLCQRTTCCAIVRVLGLLPPTVGIDRLETSLAAVEPRAQLRLAMLGERAIGRQMFAAISDGHHDFEEFRELTRGARFVQRTWFEHDEADYLEQMEIAVAAASENHAIGGETRSRRHFYNFISLLILPRWSEYIRSTTELEALLLLSRAALIAHRDGFEAARTWAASQRDPFADEPLHTRVDADGALSIWSIGKDLVDDGGPLPPSLPNEQRVVYPPPDILVRCPPP